MPNTNQASNFFNKTDFIIIPALLLCAALLSLIPQSAAEYAMVYTGNTLCKTVSLSIPNEYTLNNGVIITVKNNQIAFTSSPCPDKICVKTGFTGQSGAALICVPERTFIRVNDGKAAVDAVAR